ncbi:MAG TPA: nucleoside triphosphate pyrophosphohydrolase [Dehalococcoidia bacterium]|nr:nucleoside triphosphate pyrophosphohydrolase [Dehalococcoidia bacterium]
MPDPEELARYAELRDIVARLRGPDGCPWDREQTHESLKPFLLQEAYEVLALLDEGDYERLPEEMGDLLFQILIHAQLAEEAGEYSLKDILQGLAAKLVRRHPHVFGEARADSAAAVIEQWERLKREEAGGDKAALEGVPRSLPALAYAQELLRRAAAAGFEWPDRRDVLVKIGEELEELTQAGDARSRAEEFGDLLINLVNYARYSGIDAEEALRLASAKFRRRFERVESSARAAGRALSEMDLRELLDLWARAKADEDA